MTTITTALLLLAVCQVTLAVLITSLPKQADGSVFALTSPPLSLRPHPRTGIDTPMLPPPPPPPQLTATTTNPSLAVLFTANFSSALDLEYEADLLDPQSGQRIRLPTSEWVMESQGNSSTAETTAEATLLLTNNGGHAVMWLNRPFSESYELRFGVMPQSSSQGLSIVFFGTMPLANESRYANATSIFDLSLPPRNGDYPKYHSGALQGYSASYYRAGNGSQPCDINPNDGKCTANLRKNPGFNLVSQGDDLMIHKRPSNGVAFEVAVRRGPGPGDLSVWVDGACEMNWTDSGPGPVFGRGYIGLRQMSTTISAVFTHLEVVAAAPSALPLKPVAGLTSATKKDLARPLHKPQLMQPPSSLAQRRLRVLQKHISDPSPKLQPPNAWGTLNVALARLYVEGVKNETVAAEISAEIETYPKLFMPWANFSANGE